MITVDWGSLSDVGRVRAINEDSVLASAGMFFVADGMGGHDAGEVASALAVETLETWLAPGEPVTSQRLVRAIESANAAIFQLGIDRATEGGLGTTVVGLGVVDDNGAERLCAVNVGDSRVYRYSGGRLAQLSVDHSLVQEMVDAGEISYAQAQVHPHRNVVTRVLGIDPIVQVDSWMLDAVRGDRYLLCSDGLTGEVDDDVIAELLAEGSDPRATARRLVETALGGGGRDNVSVIVIDVVRVAADVDDDTNRRNRSKAVLSAGLIDAVPLGSVEADGPRESDNSTPDESLIAGVPEL